MTLISDAHIHVWAADSATRPWPSATRGREHRAAPLGAAEVIAEMDAAGVERAVLIPPSWEGDRNDLALQAVADYPGRFGVMGRVALTKSQHLDLSDWRSGTGMLGIRVIFAYPAEQTLLASGQVEWLFRDAETNHIPVMIYAPGMTAVVEHIAERHPGLALIVDHLNLRPSSVSRGDGRGSGNAAASLYSQVERLCHLSKRTNVAVKLSALPCYITAGDKPSVADVVRRIVDVFGPERCMWGSDLSRLPCSYRQWVDSCMESLAEFSAADRRLIMSKSLENWLTWPVGSSTSDEAPARSYDSGQGLMEGNASC